MRLIALFFIFLTLLLLGCNNSATEGVKEPQKLLSQEQLVAVLKEIYILEARIQESRFASRDTAYNVFMREQAAIFKKYTLDSITFKENLQYYSADLKQMGHIYTALTDSLTVLRDGQMPKDSIQRPATPSAQ